MAKYADYVEMCENEGTTPLPLDEWTAQRRREGQEAARAARAILDDPAVPQNPTGPDPEDGGKILVSASSLDRLMEKVDELEARLAAATSPRDPSTLPEAAAAVIPKPPEPWGSNGNYEYMSDTFELELTVEAGHTKMSNGRLVNIPDKSVKFSGGRFTTSDPAIRDWLEAQPEFNGTGGAKYPARVWRTEIMNPGHQVVQVTDGAKTSRTTPQARYADRPSPLHAKV